MQDGSFAIIPPQAMVTVDAGKRAVIVRVFDPATPSVNLPIDAWEVPDGVDLGYAEGACFEVVSIVRDQVISTGNIDFVAEKILAVEGRAVAEAEGRGERLEQR